MEMPLSEEAPVRPQARGGQIHLSRRPARDRRSPRAMESWAGNHLAERRMALRLSRDAALIDLPEPTDEITTLPSVARVLATASPPTQTAKVEELQEPDPECGDDDDAGDLDADLDDFYADALEDA